MNKRIKKKLQSLNNKSTFFIAYTDPSFEMGSSNLFLSSKKYRSIKEFEGLNEDVKGLKVLSKKSDFSAYFRHHLKLDIKR